MTNPKMYPDVDAGMKLVGVWGLAMASAKAAGLLARGVRAVVRRRGLGQEYEVWVPRNVNPSTEWKRLTGALKRRGDVTDPEALAAWIEDRKYGKGWRQGNPLSDGPNDAVDFAREGRKEGERLAGATGVQPQVVDRVEIVKAFKIWASYDGAWMVQGLSASDMKEAQRAWVRGFLGLHSDGKRNPDDLPPRTPGTMIDAIALSSPSGRMSKRARKAAERSLSLALFGPGGLPRPQTPREDPKERLLRQARELRGLAARGMSVRKFTREADRLEAEAAALPQGNPARLVHQTELNLLKAAQDLEGYPVLYPIQSWTTTEEKAAQYQTRHGVAYDPFMTDVAYGVAPRAYIDQVRDSYRSAPAECGKGGGKGAVAACRVFWKELTRKEYGT